MNEEVEAEYFSKDFEWEALKQEIENNPTYRHHLLPFKSSPREEDKESGDVKAWQSFHIRHSSGKFFKERRYLLKEFPELVSCDDFSKVLEIGCDSGSSVIPILRGNKSIIVYACDCSTETLETAKEIVDATDIISVQHRFKLFHCDFAFTEFPKWLLCNSCRSIFAQKQECFSPDVKEISMKDVNCSRISTEGSCCIGGVDFVTLVCFILLLISIRMLSHLALG